MPVSKRTGRRYAAGSHVVRGGWEPELCAGCNERVTLSGKSNLEHGGAFFQRGPPAESWHADCRRKYYGERQAKT